MPGRFGEWPLKGAVSFQGDENILKQIMLMVAQLCGHTENYSVVHWKWMNPGSVEPS